MLLLPINLLLSPTHASYRFQHIMRCVKGYYQQHDGRGQHRSTDVIVNVSLPLMINFFFPQDSLSKDDVRRVADVRRDVWRGGFSGLMAGTLTGAVGTCITTPLLCFG